MKTRSAPLQIFLFLFLTLTLILPLCAMLAKIATADAGAVLLSAQFRAAALHSITASVLTTAISVGIALLFALCVTRTRARHREFYGVLVTLPMLVPSMTHGVALQILFGANGLFTRLFGWQGSIYGLSGIVAGSVLYSFPVAYLMLADLLKNEDSSAYDAAVVLGISKWRQFCGITLPYLRKPLISVVFAVFTLVFTDYGVPLLVGGHYTTLPVLMYQEVVGLLDFGKGSVIGICLLLPAVVAFVFDMRNKDSGTHLFVTKPWEIRRSKIRDTLASFFCIALCAVVGLPMLLFVVLVFVRKYPVDFTFTMNHILRSIDMNALQYLRNSLVIAVLVACLGTVLAYTAAYLTARVRTKGTKWLHLVLLTSLAVPGLVLGLSYSLLFKDSFLYRTVSILVLVNIVHFIASPYLMAYNTLGKMNENLEAVGATLQISRLKMIKDVIVPQSFATILEMLSYFFVNAMMTISAVSFLSTTKNKPLALMIPEFEAQMLLECTAFVSIVILLLNLLVKLTVYMIKRKRR